VSRPERHRSGQAKTECVTRLEGLMSDEQWWDTDDLLPVAVLCRNLLTTGTCRYGDRCELDLVSSHLPLSPAVDVQGTDADPPTTVPPGTFAHTDGQ
jgi:hypothetical protein